EDFYYDGSTNLTACGRTFGGTCRGALTKRRVYRQFSSGPVAGGQKCTGGSDPYCVDYGTWYDGSTGNPTRHIRPEIMTGFDGTDLSNAPGTRLNYDDVFGVYATRT